MKIQEIDSTFENQHWYEVSNLGDWPGVAPFGLGGTDGLVQYELLIGDLDGNGRVQNNDAGIVNGHLTCLSNCGADNRGDINDDGRVQNADTGIVYAHMFEQSVPKPCGH
ncbi:MAG: hypothetical protein HY287_07495 [Planctomycetes bacterium]|nr:hypothetical protein [Planctomycetota bacterium]MBI3834156.1 hypothetical protein [Planctomycetota bacterium]